MENEVAQLWKFTYALGGIYVSGFLFLVGWSLNLRGKLSECVTYRWFENQHLPRFNIIYSRVVSELGGDGTEGNIVKALNSIHKVLKDIKDELKDIDTAIRGDMSGTNGILKRLDDAEHDLIQLKRNMVNNQNDT